MYYVTQFIFFDRDDLTIYVKLVISRVKQVIRFSKARDVTLLQAVDNISQFGNFPDMMTDEDSSQSECTVYVKNIFL